MLIILTITLICDGQKLQNCSLIGKISQSMEGHNDKVFGKANPNGAQVGNPFPFFCGYLPDFPPLPLPPIPPPPVYILTGNILELTQPHSSLRMRFRNKSTFECPLTLHLLKEGVQ